MIQGERLPAVSQGMYNATTGRSRTLWMHLRLCLDVALGPRGAQLATTSVCSRRTRPNQRTSPPRRSGVDSVIPSAMHDSCHLDHLKQRPEPAHW